MTRNILCRTTNTGIYSEIHRQDGGYFGFTVFLRSVKHKANKRTRKIKMLGTEKADK